jgi:hypothetical protein
MSDAVTLDANFLHAIVAGLALRDPDANQLGREATLRKAFRLTGRIGTIIGAFERARCENWPLDPVPSRGICCAVFMGTSRIPSVFAISTSA